MLYVRASQADIDADIHPVPYAACLSGKGWRTEYWRTVFCSYVDSLRPSQHRIDILGQPAPVPDHHQIMVHHPQRQNSSYAHMAVSGAQAASHMERFRCFDRTRGDYRRSSKAGRSDNWPFSLVGGMRRAVATRKEEVNAGSA